MTLNGKAISDEQLRSFWLRLRTKYPAHRIHYKGFQGEDWLENSDLHDQLQHEVDGHEDDWCDDITPVMSKNNYGDFFCASCNENLDLHMEDDDDFIITDLEIFRKLFVDEKWDIYRERMINGSKCQSA